MTNNQTTNNNQTTEKIFIQTLGAIDATKVMKTIKQ
jgi:hypothetical protein